MQQLSGIAPHTVTPSPVPATGPGADSTTPGVNGVDLGALGGECHAEVHMRIERNRVIFDVPRVRPDIRGSDLFPDYTAR